MASLPTAAPATLPRWGELNDTGGSNGYGTPASNIVAPASGNSDTGYVDGTYPPAGWINWAFKALYEWALWLSVYLSTAHNWTVIQYFNAALFAPVPILSSNLNRPAAAPLGGKMGVSGVSLAGFVSAPAVDAAATDNAGQYSFTSSATPLTAGTLYHVGTLETFSGLSPESVQLTLTESMLGASNFGNNGVFGINIPSTGIIQIFFMPTANFTPPASTGYTLHYHCDF